MSIPQNIINGIRINTNRSACIAKNQNYYLFNLFHAPFPSIKPQNTSTKETEKIIGSLKMKNSSGYDEISTKVLKISAPFISSPLCYICNKSMRSWNFRTRLKYATVKPLLKKGNKENTIWICILWNFIMYTYYFRGNCNLDLMLLSLLNCT